MLFSLKLLNWLNDLKTIRYIYANLKTNSLKHIVTGLKYHKFPNVMCKNIVFRKYTIIHD